MDDDNELKVFRAREQQERDRREYLRTGRAYAVAQHKTELHRKRLPWLAAGAAGTFVVAAGSVALGFFVTTWFLWGLLALLPAAGYLMGIHDAADDVRTAKREEFAAKLNYQEAAAEFLGIEPPTPGL
jgi:hypothetical protein